MGDHVTEMPEAPQYTKNEIKKGSVIIMSVLTLNNSNFKDAALNADKPVLIDFWASWCGPCRAQSPIIEELAEELEGSAVIAKLNVDENPELAAQFSVMSIPTLVFLKGGKVVGRRTGVTSKAELLSMFRLATV